MTAVRAPYRLSDRFVGERGTVFLTGIQALARIPFDQLRADRRAGLRTAAFVSGYPGSPLGGFDRAVATAARHADDLPVVTRPAMNEEYAATAVMGSQLANVRPDAEYDGVVGVWYGKAPGVDRASDALRHGAFAGTWWRGGAIALVGDDPAAKSSTVPSSSAGTLADMNLPLLYPADPGEALDLGLHAVAMSRATGLWVALKIVADVADGTATVDLDPDRIRPVVPLIDGQPYQRRPEGRLLTPVTLELEREIVEVRQPLVIEYAALNRLNDSPVDPTDAWIGIVASGITYREVREAFSRLGLHDDDDLARCGIRLLKMRMPLPFDQDGMRTFARGLHEVLVIEEKHPNIETLIKDAFYSLRDRPLVLGKLDDRGSALVPAFGALDADTIVPVLRRRLGERLGERLRPAAPERTHLTVLSVSGDPAIERAPFYCSGCPHNRSTEVPPGTLVGAGIGCHTMALLMDPERVGDIAGVTVMGNEGAQWIGMSSFVRTQHMVQNLGDGTYFHSGQLAVQAAVAAGVNITYKLLLNGAVAMTGGQHPEGQIGVAAIARTLFDHGVAEILVTTDDPGRLASAGLPKAVQVWDRSRLLEAQEHLAGVRGVTVLIHDQACAAELRRARKRGLAPTPPQRVLINPRVCEGCGDCGRTSNCLSLHPIDTVFGRKTMVDQTTCNLDYSCIEGDCPSFMTVTTRPKSRRRRSRRVTTAHADASRGAALPAPPTTFPEPMLLVPHDDFGVRITGVGGTGVVTVAQILGTAAMLEGYSVRGLDQIGLSQKAGPVVSDVRLSLHGDADTSRLGGGQADLLLATDLLVAASEKGLSTASPDRTVVVGSTSETPVGVMITHPELAMPAATELIDRLRTVTRDGGRFADADAITTDLFGDATSANFFLVGIAVQHGALPIAPASIEQAIELNGVAVDVNAAAFRWGRCLVSDPEALSAARDRTTVTDDETRSSRLLPHLLERLGAYEPRLRGELEVLTSDLCDYQDDALAVRFLDEIERVQRREHEVAAGSTRLTRAFAVSLHKLMAYKDEYEVARLLVAPGAMDAASEVAADGQVRWHLHPPLLRSLGLRHKIAFPTSTAPMFRALARGKRVRGTMLDPFRWGAVRREERKLPEEFLAAMHRITHDLTAERLDHAVRVATLPQDIRGYEHLKLQRVRQFRTSLTELMNPISLEV
jgi:indolepyruvate ferredoxin oxidoreductase